MKQIKFIFPALSLFTLVACGGGGGSGGVTTSVLTGNFLDGPVKGLTYVASPSGTTGTTNENGDYTFLPTDTSVSFKIGGSSGVEIAAAKPSKDAVFIADVPGGNAAAQVLISLNHGTSSSSLDVSQVKLDASTATKVNDYVSAGSIADKADSKSLMGDIQTAVKAQVSSLTFKQNGGVDETDTTSHLATTAATLPTKADAKLDPVGKPFFITSFATEKDGVALTTPTVEYFFGVRPTSTQQKMFTTDGTLFSTTVNPDMGEGKFQLTNYLFGNITRDCTTTSTLSKVDEAGFTAQSVLTGVCETSKKTMIGKFLKASFRASDLANTTKYIAPMTICGGTGTGKFTVNYGDLVNGTGNFSLTGGDCGTQTITGTYSDSEIIGVVKLLTSDILWMQGLIDDESIAFFMGIKSNGKFVQRKGGIVKKITN